MKFRLGLGFLCLLTAPAFAEAPRTSVFLGATMGSLFLSNSAPTEVNKSGMEGSLSLIASAEWEPWLFDVSGGYQYSYLSGDGIGLTQSVKVITRSFVGEVSPRFKMNLFGSPHWQLGPVLQIMTGGDVSYDENPAIEELSSQFRAGGKLIYQFGDEVLWRVGLSALSDLNVQNRQAYGFLLNLQIGLSPRFRAPPESETKKGSSPLPPFAEVKDRSIRIYLGEALLSFPKGSDKLSTKAKEALVSLAPVLMKNELSWSTIRIEGHTDIRDQNRLNQKLSEARAGAVRNELIALQVPEKRITSKGFGASQPIDPAQNEEAFLLNRRVELWIDGLDTRKIESFMSELRQIK